MPAAANTVFISVSPGCSAKLTLASAVEHCPVRAAYETWRFWTSRRGAIGSNRGDVPPVARLVIVPCDPPVSEVVQTKTGSPNGHVF